MALELHPVTPNDIPTITTLWYTIFQDPSMQHLFPNTPAMHEWWTNANATDLREKPYQKYIKVIDPSAHEPTNPSKPRIVAYAKWDLSMPDERGPRFPAWHSEQPSADNDAFFGRLERARRRVMGDRRHYYLDMLGTHPDYRRRGAGAMLVQWGCDRADADGVGAYVDASVDGKGLYEKFGFVDYSGPEEGEVAAMARK
ncbi:hypothetical protein N7492_010009 [Penicillium capsulatum]|uniref:N-acetyltransferase domain-containing protein n=1 Tax=Penicillium capsulatum TaxID=69766 RepID=A0A9W9HMM2_9EURO|nr:hypothetical protein N7492_010009 [Penicillium capsulatum]KAJ6112518.1 hypothetical protein N7512_007842 [Penicillium capsulatum]